jgi:crotonobetainyl-CoA:carnitine CoA-transferase CaiB-like acyl-CoA transferase
MNPDGDTSVPGRAADLLDDLLGQAGVRATEGQVLFRGQDPVFPTVFPMAELGAAAIGAAALQAARLYEDRTGVRQDIAIELDSAAAAMRSWRYIREVPPPLPSSTPHPVAFYRTADERWLFLHRLAQHHLQRELAVLGLPEHAAGEDIARAVAEWRGEDLEEAIMQAGACAAVVRTAVEWAAHQQAQAIATLPLFTITKTADSAPLPAGTGDRPLGGLRVLDLTRVLAGPTAARTLAEHGAEVLRISSPRYPDTLPMVQDTAHGKRSSVLDLRRGDDAAALRRLIGGADVFSQGYRPGAIARLGFSPGEVAAIRPGIITVSLSAFGGVGPWGDRRGFDSVVQAASGVAAEMGEALGDGVPRSMPGNPLDYTTGYLAAFLVQVALERRAREGGSYHIEMSLAQTGRYLDRAPRLDSRHAASRPTELADDRLAELMLTRDTPYGKLRYLAPVARLSATPAAWERPTVPADHDLPTW